MQLLFNLAKISLADVRLLLSSVGIHVRALVKTGGLVARDISGILDYNLADTPLLQHLLQMDDVPGLSVLPLGPRDIDAHRRAHLPL